MKMRDLSNTALSSLSDEELLKIAEVVSDFSDAVSNEIFKRFSTKLETSGWIPVTEAVPPMHVMIDFASAYSGTVSKGVVLELENGAYGVHLDTMSDTPTHWRLSGTNDPSVQ